MSREQGGTPTAYRWCSPVTLDGFAELAMPRTTNVLRRVKMPPPLALNCIVRRTRRGPAVRNDGAIVQRSVTVPACLGDFDVRQSARSPRTSRRLWLVASSAPTCERVPGPLTAIWVMIVGMTALAD